MESVKHLGDHREGTVARMSVHLASSLGVFDKRRRQSSAIGSRNGGFIVLSTDSGTRFRSGATPALPECGGGECGDKDDGGGGID